MLGYLPFVAAAVGIYLLVVNLRHDHGEFRWHKSQKATGETVPPEWAPSTGKTCRLHDPSVNETCTMPYTHCGFYQACPRCVCDYGMVSISHRGTEYCIPGGLRVYDSCRECAQCPPYASCVMGSCHCDSGYVSDYDGTGCHISDKVNDPCSPKLGCGAGYTCPAITNSRCTACSPYCTSCQYVGTGYCDSGSCYQGYKYVIHNGKGFCSMCSDVHCANCAMNLTYCSFCQDGYWSDNGTCKACAMPCKTCRHSATNCTSCIDGFYRTAVGDMCKRQALYGQPCVADGESYGVECDIRMLAGVCNYGKCCCKKNFVWTNFDITCQWNTLGHACIHINADIHVQEGGECHWDRVSFRNLKDANQACQANSDLLKICDHGLDCVSELHCSVAEDGGRVVTGKRCRAPLPKTPITTSPPPTPAPTPAAAAVSPSSGGIMVVTMMLAALIMT